MEYKLICSFDNEVPNEFLCCLENYILKERPDFLEHELLREVPGALEKALPSDVALETALLNECLGSLKNAILRKFQVPSRTMP